MKRKPALLLLALTLVAGFAFLNIQNNQAPQTLLEHRALSLSLNGHQETILDFDLLSRLGQDFTATFQRQVGDPITRTYTGVPLEALLLQSDLTLAPGDAVDLTAIDNYTIRLSYEEIITPDHAYIALAQEGQPLDDQSGPYMLITAQDTVSTRWNRRLVDINLIRGGE